jgi:hypothetical protein
MEWFRIRPERVSLNVILGVKTSTVLLPKQHANDKDIYETCVFESDDSNVIGIYETEAEAIAGHNRIIKEQLMRI